MRIRASQPLDEGFGRVLADDLATLLGSRSVFSSPWKVRETLDYLVEIDVTHFEVLTGSRRPSSRRVLATMGRVICFDKRGTGISDPVPLGALPTIERWMDHITTVTTRSGQRSAVACKLSNLRLARSNGPKQPETLIHHLLPHAVQDNGT